MINLIINAYIINPLRTYTQQHRSLISKITRVVLAIFLGIFQFFIFSFFHAVPMSFMTAGFIFIWPKQEDI